MARRHEACLAENGQHLGFRVLRDVVSDDTGLRLWTFRRDLAARDPNWLLIETDEEE